MNDYRICTHAAVADQSRLGRQLSQLDARAFGHYYGNVIATPSWVEWAGTRPGTDPTLCQAVFAGEELVCSLVVTRWPMRLAGEIVGCGIVDQVMTHPDHRRRGLARASLERALAAMTAREVTVSLLYTLSTEPVSGPQRLYEGLGYKVCEQVDRFVKDPPHLNQSNPLAVLPADQQTRARVEGIFGEHDGWLVTDDSLWRWRRLVRPADYPVSLVQGGLGQYAAIVTGDFLVDRKPSPFALITELLLPTSCDPAEALAEVTSLAPAGVTISLLSSRANLRAGEGLRRNGFRVEGTEVAMLRALTARGARLLEQRRGPWYVAVESVIGV